MKRQILKCIASCVVVLMFSSCNIVRASTPIQAGEVNTIEAVNSAEELETWVSDWSVEKADSGATELPITVKG